MADLFVAVCTDRPEDPPAVPAGALLIRELELGLAVARNRALEAAGDADVLVLLADDAEVGEPWWDQVRAYWDSAPQDVAVLGGPVVVRVDGARPAWADDDVLGKLDFGALPTDLEPRDSLSSTALSFRAAALRGIGGFWPARGHRLGRDWWSDERIVQTELTRAGWKVHYEPGLIATRVVRDEELRVVHHLRSRFRYGARRGAFSDRDVGAAVRTAASATAAVPPAVLRPPRKVAVSRAAEAAEAVGVLLAPVAAHAERQPAVESTPFLPYVAERERRALVRRRRGPAAQSADHGDGALVLLYHRVAGGERDPLGLSVSPEHFSQQLEILRRERDVVPLDEVVDALRGGQARPGAVAITFDDGYRDNALEADPRLAQAGLPATLFVTTGHVEAGAAFWWDEVNRLLDAVMPSQRPAEVVLGGAPTAFLVAGDEQREAVRSALQQRLPTVAPAEAERAVAALREALGGDDEAPRPMTRDELLALEAFSLGGHTRRHPSLRCRDVAEQREEIEGSRDDLEAWTGARPRGFAYPWGESTEVTRRLVREAGYDHAMGLEPRLVSAGSDLFSIPRFPAPDLGGERFARWLEDAQRPATRS